MKDALLALRERSKIHPLLRGGLDASVEAAENFQAPGRPRKNGGTEAPILGRRRGHDQNSRSEIMTPPGQHRRAGDRAD